jgi:hypothetical protein
MFRRLTFVAAILIVAHSGLSFALPGDYLSAAEPEGFDGEAFVESLECQCPYREEGRVYWEAKHGQVDLPDFVFTQAQIDERAAKQVLLEALGKFDDTETKQAIGELCAYLCAIAPDPAAAQAAMPTAHSISQACEGQ